MSSEHEPPLNVEAEARALVEELRTLVLATTSDEGVAQASYAPFVQHDGAFHVFVSALARHTGNLLARPRASVLLVEDEARAAQVFARKRLAFDCDVREVERGSPQAETVLDRFDDRFGHVMSLIRPLPDFRLLRLEPRRGTYVRGFGQAFTFDGGALSGFSHVDEAAIRGRRR
jgi:putative heme iron utilization protein